MSHQGKKRMTNTEAKRLETVRQHIERIAAKQQAARKNREPADIGDGTIRRIF